MFNSKYFLFLIINVNVRRAKHLSIIIRLLTKFITFYSKIIFYVHLLKIIKNFIDFREN